MWKQICMHEVHVHARAIRFLMGTHLLPFSVHTVFVPFSRNRATTNPWILHWSNSLHLFSRRMRS